VFDDPQLGAAAGLRVRGFNSYDTEQFSQELRLQWTISDRVEANLGAIHLDLERFNESYIFSNTLTAFAQAQNFGGAGIYVDPEEAFDGTGHNYFLSRNPYRLKSDAVFGEVYWTLSDTVRLTLGARYTQDNKTQTILPVQLLTPGRGFPANPVVQEADFDALTGRAVVDWRPALSFTDNTLLYASYSRGYKGGGFNPPDIVATSPTYRPEAVDAFEVGTKNTLADGAVTLNATGFFYGYQDYQISQIFGLSVQTANVDVEVSGLELEGQWRPSPRLRFDANLGYLNSSISGGAAINPFDRTNGDPSLTLLKSTGSACVGPTAGVAALVSAINAGLLPATALIAACPTDAAPTGVFGSSDPSVNPLAAFGIVVPTSAGVPVQLRGKSLPNAPELTFALGVQYRQPLAGDWEATFRIDGYWQASAFADVFNDPVNELRSWTNANLTIGFASDTSNWSGQIFAKNLFDRDVVSNALVTADAVGLVRAAALLDPRTFGISIGRRF
jgi:outer membrane receptor protein involved in Fe transport